MLESWLAARGLVYERRTFTDSRGKVCTYYRCSRRPLADVYGDLLNNRIPTRRQPQTGRHDPADDVLSFRHPTAGQRAQPDTKNPG